MLDSDIEIFKNSYYFWKQVLVCYKMNSMRGLFKICILSIYWYPGDDDGDGIPDHLDNDDDGDGIPDEDEGQQTFFYQC